MEEIIPKKPQIKVDAILLIDIWGVESWMNPVITDNFKKYFTVDEWRDYMTRYIDTCSKHLQRFSADTVINATYSNSENLAYEPNAKTQSSEFAPLHYIDYNDQPKKYLYTHCTMLDIYKHVPPGGKIIVGGGSWGACVHYREVGMVNLIRQGFKVYTAPELCYSMPNHMVTKTPLNGIHPLDMLWDDIVWSRCHLMGHFYDYLFQAMTVHPDNALGRTNPKGIAMRDTIKDN